ncbi:MAG: response regulator transcription factor [Thermoanaerobaculia bacterium]|nr:response regulator transcription factor [Thermoanaerobaculia bacterium]
MTPPANVSVAPLSAESIRVYIVEDDRLLRDSLRMLIGGSAGFACVGAAGSMEEALASPVKPPPQVVLLDIHLPGTRGSIGVIDLLDRWPESVVLMHTVYEEDDLVFESLCNGASGYILKRTPPARLLEAIAETRRGGAPMSPEIARKVLSRFRKLGSASPAAEEVAGTLSPQETRLLALIAAGSSYREAAVELDVSINTVRTHIRSIYEKLQVHTKSEAVAKAMRSGLI